LARPRTRSREQEAGNYDSIFSLDFGRIAHYDDCFGTLTSDGYNLAQNYTNDDCVINGAFRLTAPLLSPLQFNGGSTLTHLPLPGSLAINAGNPGGSIDSGPFTISADQRGFLGFGACDIGAVERSFELDLPLVRR
jgi:hypothetical protein